VVDEFVVPAQSHGFVAEVLRRAHKLVFDLGFGVEKSLPLEVLTHADRHRKRNSKVDLVAASSLYETVAARARGEAGAGDVLPQLGRVEQTQALLVQRFDERGGMPGHRSPRTPGRL
jgi:hypothetical protein